jgi:pyruvate dehydrogenase E1 component alpha subunit
MTAEVSREKGPDGDRSIRLLTDMIRIRRFEEKCAELYSATKIRGFLHLYVGEEAVAVGVLSAFEPGDSVVSTYREHGHALARGLSARAIMAEMFGKVDGCSRGRGGSMHLFDAGTRFFGGNAIVGGGIPLAAGIALGDLMRETGQVTVCFFGEGAMAEGEFHEAMNLSALWKLPVVFVCENNLYAMGTALERSESETHLSLKAASYGIPAWTVDGMDVLRVAEAAKRAATVARSGDGPVFLEVQTYRFRAHSMYDPELYREKAEVEEWKQRCPIAGLSGRLLSAGLLTPEALQGIEDAVAAEIEDAIAFAEAAPLEAVEDLTRFVYSEAAL